MREKLEELWEETTGLGNAYYTPLAQAIIEACLAVAEGADKPWETMSDAVNTLRANLDTLEGLLSREAQREAQPEDVSTLFELKLTDGTTLVTWNTIPGIDFAPAISFPPHFWELGVMVLNGEAITITGGVELIRDGVRIWLQEVPRGAAKRLAELTPTPENRCCIG